MVKDLPAEAKKALERFKRQIPGYKDEDYIELAKSPAEIVAMGYDEATVHRSILLVNRNEYKRFQTPPILRVSSKAFGFGRKMPLVAKYAL